MDTSNYASKIYLKEADKITALVENICQEHNIAYYYGSISVSIEQLLSLIGTFYGDEVENKEVLFYFEQCVGGVSFSVECKDDVFSKVVFEKTDEIDIESDLRAFLVAKLSDQIIISKGGCKIELLFFVNGIEPELLVHRQEKIKQFNATRIHQNIS